VSAYDLLIVGAGPAGAVTALVAARAGARVCILDRSSFPRAKLCGDTVNPGAMARLAHLGLAADVEARGLPVDGMVVTGDGAAVVGRYPRGLCGRAIRRVDLDWILLRAAITAGCEFEPGVAVRRAVVDDTRNGPAIQRVEVGRRSGVTSVTARVIVAADGRRSTIAFDLGFLRHPPRPRRWAIGGYFAGVSGPEAGTAAGGVVGEMHIRKDGYLGVAPIPDGLTNVCLVRPVAPRDAALRDPADALRRAIESDPALRARFSGATPISQPVVLGPLAVDPIARPPIDGLLLAGDAAGFIDPMTGDGLNFAIRGGELAAAAALSALAHGWRGVHEAHAAARAEAFGAKWHFNRALRMVVASPLAISAGVVGARVLPAALRAIVTRAGDCHQVA
jgi:flavin-dependent dehydrogenase